MKISVEQKQTVEIELDLPAYYAYGSSFYCFEEGKNINVKHKTWHGETSIVIDNNESMRGLVVSKGDQISADKFKEELFKAQEYINSQLATHLILNENAA